MREAHYNIKEASSAAVLVDKILCYCREDYFMLLRRKTSSIFCTLVEIHFVCSNTSILSTLPIHILILIDGLHANFHFIMFIGFLPLSSFCCHSVETMRRLLPSVHFLLHPQQPDVP
jgi:hypothetical protein